MGDDYGRSLARGLLFWVAAQCIIEADALYHEANLCESWNAPWARNCRRRGDRMMDRAKAFVGGGELPWGVPWPEPQRED